MIGKGRDFRDDGSLPACAAWVLGYLLVLAGVALWVLSLVFGQGAQP